VRACARACVRAYSTLIRLELEAIGVCVFLTKRTLAFDQIIPNARNRSY